MNNNMNIICAYIHTYIHEIWNYTVLCCQRINTRFVTFKRVLSAILLPLVRDIILNDAVVYYVIEVKAFNYTHRSISNKISSIHNQYFFHLCVVQQQFCTSSS
jgi:hypothetical protein